MKNSLFHRTQLRRNSEPTTVFLLLLDKTIYFRAKFIEASKLLI